MNGFATRQQSSLGNASCDSVASARSVNLSQASYASTAQSDDDLNDKMQKVLRLNTPGGKQKQSIDSIAEDDGAGISCINPPEVAHQQPGSASPVEATPSQIHDFGAHAWTPAPGMHFVGAIPVYGPVYPVPVPGYPIDACFGFNETPVIDLEQQTTPAKRFRQTAGKWLGRGHQGAGQASPVKKKHGKAQASTGSGKELPYATEEEWQSRIDKRQEAVDNMKSNPIYYEHQKSIPAEKRPKTPDPSDRRSSKRDWEADVSTWRAAWRDLAGVDDLMQMGCSKPDSLSAWKAAARRLKNQKPATSSTQCFEDLKKEAIAILFPEQ